MRRRFVHLSAKKNTLPSDTNSLLRNATDQTRRLIRRLPVRNVLTLHVNPLIKKAANAASSLAIDRI